LVNVGDEWTYATKRQGIFQDIVGINITSVPAPPGQPLGTIYINGTATMFNQMIDEEYLINNTMITALKANYSVKTRSYGGVSCDCVYITTSTGYIYVDTATGIIVETYDVFTLIFINDQIKVHKWVISWSVTDFPENPKEPSAGSGEIPGYDILFIIGITALSSTALAIGFKRRLKLKN